MRHLFLSLFLLNCSATAVQAAGIVGAEYFVGADPGEELGTPLAISGSDANSADLVNITIPVGSLPAGTHNVGVRVRDEAGQWSNPLIRRFTVNTFTMGGGIDPLNPSAATSFAKQYQPLTQAEYFVGTDPGEGNGTPLALTGSDDIARDLAYVAISVSSLPAGTHSVGVRVRDEAGQWSSPLIRRFTVNTFTMGGGIDPSNPNAASSFAKAYQALTQAEYFVGADPGDGNGTPLVLTGSDGLARELADATIPVSGLPAGTHNIGVRVRDEAGQWSNPLIRRFTVNTFTMGGGIDPSNPNAGMSFAKPYEPLTQAEYFVGADPGDGNGTPLALIGSDGVARELADATIPVSGLPAGTHTIGVRVRDEAGRWSNPLFRRFTVNTFTMGGGIDPSNPNAATSFAKPYEPLAQAEYFVGADPGQGNGTPLVMPPDAAGLARDITDVPIPLTMPPGTYDVGVRVKDESGEWSNPLRRRFTLYRTDVLAAQRGGTKLVDLEFDLVHGQRNCTVTVLVSQDGGVTWSVPTGSVTGDVGTSVTPGRQKRLVWHAGEDWDNGFSEDMQFRVIAYETAQDVPPGFAAVMPGSFTMGSPAGEIGRVSDEAERPLQMRKPFFLKSSEVTWSEWNTVRNQGPAFGYTDIAAGRNGLNGDGSGNYPVTDVSWMDAVKWCNLKSEIEGKKPVYYSDASLNPATVVRTGIPAVHAFWNAGGYRLPSEAEWEFACRAGIPTAFHSGAITNEASDPALDTAGWYAANSGGNTQLVNGKSANALGLRDMHGNVREWCWDAYGAYPPGPQWNPVTGAAGAARVLRGGSWNLTAADCRAAARTSSGQNSRGTDIGFRIAINYTGLNDALSTGGIPVDSRDPAAGNLIAGLRPAFNGSVYALASQPDGKLLLGGDFTTVDGLTRQRLARLNADGSLDASFLPAADSTVYSIALLPDGKILLGGDFSSVAGGPVDFVARLNADGTLDAAFHPPVDYVVQCMAVQPDGKILIGGDFGFIGGVARNRLARLHPDGSLDTTFNPNVDGTVRTLALQSDGRVLLGGAFATVGGTVRGNLARVNADGTTDPAFTTGTDGTVTCLAIQPGGQILAGGAFTSAGGQTRNGLARLSASGAPDAAFNPDVNGQVRSIAQQADGRILLGGEFTAVSGATRNRMAALSATGALETAFALSFSGAVHALNLLPNGKLAAAGNFSSANGVARQRLAWIDNDAASETLTAMSSSRVRWLRGGSLPEAAQVSFELSTDAGTTWLPLGNAVRISGGWERNGVNLPASGQLRAKAFIPSGSGNASSALMSSSGGFSDLVTIPEIAVQTSAGADIPDGGSLAFGTLTMGSGKSLTLVIRNLGYGDLTGLTITKDGANPSDFQVITSPAAPVTGPAGGTTLVIRFTPDDSGPRSAAIHIASNDNNENPFDIQLSGAGVVAGQLADAFDPNVSGRVNAIAVQPDGKVIIAGGLTNVGDQPRGRFARLNADMSLESTATFAAGSGANSNVLAAAVQRDGKILLAGQFTSINAGNSRSRLARLMPNGSVETTDTFNIGTGFNNTVQTIALQADGKIIAAGDFISVNGQSRVRIARLNSDGTLEDTATFNAGTGAGGTVHCLALQPDGKILLGGVFTTFNGQPRQRLARLLSNGTLDPGFIVDAGDKVSCLAVQPDGKIVVGGPFTSIGGEARNGIARLLPDGTVEDINSFDPGTGTDGEVSCIALQAGGSILLGGAFTLINDELRAGIARLYPNGTLESSITFDTVVGPDALVRGLALRPDGAVIAGGDFTDYNGFTRGRLALLANQPAIDTLVVSGMTRIDWNRDGTAAEIAFPMLELSINGGASWTPLPAPVRKSGGWECTGLTLPSAGILRARGQSSGGWAGASGGLVEMVKPFVNAPLVTTLPATAITYNSALLHAAVVANGTAGVRFEYGPTTGYGSFTPVQTVTGGELIELSAPVSGLSGLYHFRVVADTTGGTYQGYDLSFVTRPEPPVAVTANPVSVTGSSATLVGAVNPKGRQTSVYFEYGATTLYGNTTPVQLLAAGNAAVELGVPLSGLSANAAYHYRIVATSSGGTSYGSDVSFQAASGGAPSAAPSVTTGEVVNAGTTAATLTGTVNPNGGFTNAFFEFGPTNALGGVTPALGAGNGSVPGSLSWNLTQLTPGTEYHYRLAATNSLGTTQGNIQTFTTNFPPPVVSTGGAVSLTTTSVRVSGTVRASNAAAQVFCDYGTDGIAFPNTVSAVPAVVSGNTETPVTADLLNLQGGVTCHYRIRAVNSGGTTAGATASFQVAVLSGLLQQFPLAPPSAPGMLTVNIEPPGIGAGWRLAGEQQWREPGSTAAGLTTDDRIIEFRPVPGYIQPPQETVGVQSGGAATVFETFYHTTPSPGSGGFSLTLKPDSIAATGVPEAERAQWRLSGEVPWRDSGSSVNGLFPGKYLVECKPVAGRTTPPPATVVVVDAQTSLATLTYFLADAPTGTPPGVLEFATVSTSQNLPYAYVGQIRSDAGLSSGFAVKPRVVATAGHVVWNDATLSAVTGLQWLFQRHRGTFESKPQIPRGFYLFDGYAAARAEPGVIPGEGTPASQNLDVAAMYFQENAGRDGFSGFLASDLPGNEFLLSPAQKILAGYPVDGIAAPDQGRMHATPAMNVPFTQGFGRTYTTSAVRGSGGASGGPLCVQYQGGNYYPAAVYLGGSAQTVVRAIDSAVIDLFNRAEVSGGGGQNNTGGGITHTSVTVTGAATQPGALKVLIEPAAAITAGAGWRLSPETSYRQSGAQRGSLTAGTYTLQLKAIPGYPDPAPQTITVTGGAVTTKIFDYVSNQSPLEAWRDLNFGITANTGNAADSADPDHDGGTNSDEYTALTDPNNGASSFTAVAITDAAGLHIRFTAKAGRSYRLETTSTLSGVWQTLNTRGATARDEEVDWLLSPAQARRFCRVVAELP